MSVAFIIAAVVWVVTIALSMLAMGAAEMSDSPEDNTLKPTIRVFVTGSVIATLIASSHFLHLHLNW